jgi:hypothetical protein
MSGLRDVELDLATILGASDLGLTLGSNLFAGPHPASAGAFVAVRETDGDAERFVADSVAYIEARVQVLVVGEPHRYKQTKDLAFGCWSALFVNESEPYSVILAQGAGPRYLGPDENSRHQFVFDASASYLVDAIAALLVTLPPGDREVDGDLFVSGAVVLRAPAGGLWRVTVDDDGALVTEAVPS